jgi:predicted esterase YcpF (UPF0227 family)
MIIERDWNVIVLFHGFGSTYEGSGIISYLKNELEEREFEVNGISWPSADFNRAHKKLHLYLSQLIGSRMKENSYQLDGLMNDELHLVGHSFGAFWARYFASLYSADSLIMLNPVCKPHIALEKYKGRNDGFKFNDGNPFNVTSADLSYIRSLYDQVEQGSPDQHANIILTEDDEVIDHKLTQKYFNQLPSRILTEGGHRFSTQSSRISVLNDILVIVNQIHG